MSGGAYNKVWCPNWLQRRALWSRPCLELQLLSKADIDKGSPQTGGMILNLSLSSADPAAKYVVHSCRQLRNHYQDRRLSKNRLIRNFLASRLPRLNHHFYSGNRSRRVCDLNCSPKFGEWSAVVCIFGTAWL